MFRADDFGFYLPSIIYAAEWRYDAYAAILW
jgi:hypothetical protein